MHYFLILKIIERNPMNFVAMTTKVPTDKGLLYYLQFSITLFIMYK